MNIKRTCEVDLKLLYTCLYWRFPENGYLSLKHVVKFTFIDNS